MGRGGGRDEDEDLEQNTFLRSECCVFLFQSYREGQLCAKRIFIEA